MLGMKTWALYSGSGFIIAPVNAVPLSVVVPLFADGVGICGQSGQCTPHSRCTRAPHSWPAAHTPQSSLPPQPSPISPQYTAVSLVQVYGVQSGELAGVPHRLGRPRPPQVWLPEQPPQSIS